MNTSYLRNKKESLPLSECVLYCVRESNLIKWFILILFPIFSITIASIYVPKLTNYFPSFAIQDCYYADDYD